MTLVVMEGFEDIIDNTDLTPARGWTIPVNNAGSGSGVITVPSRTPVPGRGLYLRGPYSATVGNPMAATTTIDFGMLSTGKSINSLWNAGGFAVGFNATFNKALQQLVGCQYTGQLIYDGSTYYWTIFYTGAGYTVAYSPDLINWTAVATAPSSISGNSSLTIIGSGLTATIIIGQSPSSPSAIASYQYSTNLGASWTVVATGTSSMRPIPGNATYALLTPWYSGSSTPGLVYQTSIAGAGQSVVSGLGLAAYTAGNAYKTVSKVVAGMVCFCTWSSSGAVLAPNSTATSWWTIAPITANLSLAASYIASAVNSGGYANDITFFNNLWISVGFGGIYSAPNSGTVSVPAGPTAAWVQRAANPSAIVWSVDCNSTICVAVGEDSVTGFAAIWTSTNGTTWTKVNRFLFSTTTSMYFNTVIWSGTQFVIVGQGNNNVVATSPDGLVWTPVYYTENTEVVSTGTASFLGVYSGTISAGVYHPTFTSSGFVTAVGFLPAAVSAGARVVSPATLAYSTVAGTTTTPTASVPVSTSTSYSHYYELIFTATATVNAFTCQWALDGVIIGTVVLPGNGLASTGDTTGIAQLLINLPRNGQFTVIDDIYVTTMNGANNVGQLGVCNIVPHVGTTDAQAQFTKNGTAASNSLSASGNALSNAFNSVSTYTTGAKDIYSSSSAIPANYRIKAIQVEGYLSRAGTVASSGTVGIISGAVEVDSAVVPANSGTPSYASVISELDPNTGVAWTAASALASEISVTKVT